MLKLAICVVAWLVSSAGLASTLYEESIEKFSVGDIEQKKVAVDYFLESVEQVPNDPVPYYILGVAFLNGLGVEQDVAKSIDYLEKSSLLGHVYGSY